MLTKIYLIKQLVRFFALLATSSMVFAEGSPWLTADATTTISTSVTSGSTDRFFIGETSTSLGGDLDGSFLWLSVGYGYDDIWAFDARSGYAETSFESNPVEQSDVADTSIGVSYQFLNEFELDNGLPTVSVRLGYTIGGDYETNLIDAIGDGASGFDVSLLFGKSLNSQFAIFGDVTLRQRDENVADGVKLLLSGYYTSPIPALGFQLAIAGVRTDSDVNIGDAGFGVDQFPRTDRDSDWLIGGVNYAFNSGIGVGFSYSSLLSGKNIPDSDIGTFNVSYTF